MPFITLTLVVGGVNGTTVAVRRDDVRVLEAREREQVLEGGEWKVSPLSATLLTLFNGTQYLVAESAADILKHLENTPS